MCYICVMYVSYICHICVIIVLYMCYIRVIYCVIYVSYMCYICVIYVLYMCYICKSPHPGRPTTPRPNATAIDKRGPVGEGGAVREKVLVVTQMQTAVGGDCRGSDGGW